MNRYTSITFSAIFLVMTFFPCQVSAASITETKAAIGKGCVASGSNSTATGYHTTASGQTSTAMGSYTRAIGSFSTAMGKRTTAGGDYSTAIGWETTAGGLASTAMGVGTKAESPFSWAGGGLMQLTATADHTFVWGYSDSPQSISTANAFLIFPAGTIGRVGIGTPSPAAQLHVKGNGWPESFIYLDTHGAGQDSGIRFYENNFVKGHLYHYTGGDPDTRSLIFTYEGVSNQLVLHSNGNVGIGTSSPSKKLYVYGSAGGTQAWNASDQREKTDIKPIKYALDNVSKLRGVSYKWKEGDEDESRGFDNKVHFGVIAQEVEKVYPELVDNPGDTEQRKHVEYNALVGILIEAVKELKVQNEALNQEIGQIKAALGL